MSHKFCDDHEWVGGPGETCPECDALHEMASLPTVKVLLPMPEVKPPRPEGGHTLLEPGEKVATPEEWAAARARTCPECSGPNKVILVRQPYLPVYDYHSKLGTGVVLVYPRGKASRLVGAVDDLACLEEWDKEANFGRAPTTREILELNTLASPPQRPIDKLYAQLKERYGDKVDEVIENTGVSVFDEGLPYDYSPEAVEKMAALRGMTPAQWIDDKIKEITAPSIFDAIRAAAPGGKLTIKVARSDFPLGAVAPELRPYDVYITTDERDYQRIIASNVMARSEEDAVEVYRANTQRRTGKAHLIAKPTPQYFTTIKPEQVEGPVDPQVKADLTGNLAKAVIAEYHDSVWDALGGDNLNMKLRSQLMREISRVVRSWGITQTAAATQLGIRQPRLNDLLSGKIDMFSLDALVRMAPGAGLELTLQVEAKGGDTE